jgi:acetyltransferase-like isoleucine patch superfamily enzyme
MIMEHIEDKLQAFIDNTLTANIILCENELDEYKIRRQDPAHLKGVLFEKGAMNWSPSFQDTANRIFIGAYSSIRSGGYMRSGVFMGRHSGIGYRCTIAAGMHNFSGVSINPDTIMARESSYTDEELAKLDIPRNRTSSKEMNSKPVIIGNDVYLGDGIIVMPGVTIGDGAVVAANAVVTSNVAPYTIVGGIPARKIRDRFPDEVKEALLKTTWWNAKLDVLKSLPVDNVFKFVDSFNSLTGDIWDNIPTLGFQHD